jgi:hypothetical protein
MQTETRYLYVDNTIEKQNKTKGFTEKYFTVIKVPTFNDNYYKAEKKARTIVQKLGLKLAGVLLENHQNPTTLSLIIRLLIALRIPKYNLTRSTIII